MRWVRRLADRFDWDRPGVLLALLLFLGEGVAVVMAGISLVSNGYDGGQLAALVGAAVLVLYVPLAIWQGKLPFAAPTEYERRRKYAQAVLGVQIPRAREKMGNVELGFAQISLPDSSDESIRAAVGRAYCLGDKYVDFLGTAAVSWKKEVLLKIYNAINKLLPPHGTGMTITMSPEVLEPKQE